MLGLGNNQESKFEAVRKQEAFRKQTESRSGGFDIMRLRFGIIRQSIYDVTISPTILRAQNNDRQAQAEAEKLKFNQEIDRLAEIAELESAMSMPAVESKLDLEIAESDVIYDLPNANGVNDQNKMAASARTAADTARTAATAAPSSADTHNFRLQG